MRQELQQPRMAANEITIRAFDIADYDGALAVWDAAEGVEICEGDSREEIRAFLQRNPGLSRVAETHGSIVGAALCGHDGRRGWIYHLAVHPAQRGRGIAKRLLDGCVRGLAAAGIKRAIILVAGDNAAGREFWLRNGWENLTAIAMSRDL